MLEQKGVIFDIKKLYKKNLSAKPPSKPKKRNFWTIKEDKHLLHLINQCGCNDWEVIAKEMSKISKFDRTAKQIKERYMNHIHPSLNPSSYSNEERRILFEKQCEYGNRWSKISQFLPGRSENSIKNYFYSSFRKYLRHWMKSIKMEKCMPYIEANDVYKLIRKEKLPLNSVNKELLYELVNRNITQLCNVKTKCKEKCLNRQIEDIQLWSGSSSNDNRNEKDCDITLTDESVLEGYQIEWNSPLLEIENDFSLSFYMNNDIK